MEGLSSKLNAGREGVVREFLEERESGAGLAIVEDHASAGRLYGDEVDGGAEGFEREVRDDTQPREECRNGCIEAGGVELLGERLAFEIDGNIGEVCRSGEAPDLQQFVLPLLCGG